MDKLLLFWTVGTVLLVIGSTKVECRTGEKVECIVNMKKLNFKKSEF